MDELEGKEAALHIEVSATETGDPVFVLAGELDISNADRVRDAVQPILQTSPKRLVFEVRDLTFMDSSGIAVLVFAANALGSIELRHASPIVRRVVEATGLSEILRIDP
jgi:anti-anti-sigma factor